MMRSADKWACTPMITLRLVVCISVWVSGCTHMHTQTHTNASRQQSRDFFFIIIMSFYALSSDDVTPRLKVNESIWIQIRVRRGYDGNCLSVIRLTPRVSGLCQSGRRWLLVHFGEETQSVAGGRRVRTVKRWGHASAQSGIMVPGVMIFLYPALSLSH